MNTEQLACVAVEPDLLEGLESVPTEGETVAAFVDASVRASVERRHVQTEFVARVLRSRDEARRTGEYVEAHVVIEGLQHKFSAARARVAGSPK